MPPSIIPLIQYTLHPEMTVQMSPSEQDWYAIYEEAKRQALLGITFYGVQQLRNHIPNAQFRIISSSNGSPKPFRFKNATSLWTSIAGNYRKNYRNQAYAHPFSKDRQWHNSTEMHFHPCANLET